MKICKECQREIISCINYKNESFCGEFCKKKYKIRISNEKWINKDLKEKVPACFSSPYFHSSYANKRSTPNLY